MYCHNCGTEVTEGASFCQRCGARVSLTSERMADAAPPAAVPNRLALAVVATCVSLLLLNPISLVFGIVAIVFASQVEGRLARGDVGGARRASDSARTWAWVAIWLAVALVAGLLLLLLVVFAGLWVLAGN